MAYSLGIDLGTTLSAAATARDGLIEIVQLGEQTATMPSIVVVRADVEVLVGDAAERESANEPSRTARGFKRRSRCACAPMPMPYLRRSRRQAWRT